MTGLDGASMKKIGQGEDAEIFALDGRRVLKLFFPHHRDLAEPEADITRRVQQAGLPAPTVNRIVEVEGRRGILFDAFDEGITLRRRVRRQPWRLLEAARLLAKLQAAIHARGVPGLPSQRAELARQIEEAAALSADMTDAALAALQRLPDGEAVCHNDLHLNNLILTPRGPVVIDWVLATQGHPLSDVARTCLMLRLGRLPVTRLASSALQVMRAAFERAYLAAYFALRPGSPDDVRAWELPVAAALVGRRTHEQRDQLLAVVASHLNARRK
jgi:aminoglycoside phosphotransferase (APT) family kinase protein